jgi:hypothetical protein
VFAAGNDLKSGLVTVATFDCTDMNGVYNDEACMASLLVGLAWYSTYLLTSLRLRTPADQCLLGLRLASLSTASKANIEYTDLFIRTYATVSFYQNTNSSICGRDLVLSGLGYKHYLHMHNVIVFFVFCSRLHSTFVAVIRQLHTVQ